LFLGWGALGVLATFPGGDGGPPVLGDARAVAHAQDSPAAAPATAETAPPRKSLLSNVYDSGWIGFVIILCSIVGFSLAITFAFQLRRDTLVPPEVLGQVEQCFEEENYEEAFHVCEAHPSLFSAVMAAGLAKIDRSYEEIENAMIDSGDLESNKLHQKVGWLSLIAAIAPMLGLFGTVAGMIQTFNVIAGSQTQPKPAQLASGISMALVTTYEGLLVAIPMTVLFVVFRNKVVNILLEVGAVTEELMDRFKGNK
jgi:biopolymer transport protein ExbB